MFKGITTEINPFVLGVWARSRFLLSTFQKEENQGEKRRSLVHSHEAHKQQGQK